MVRPELLQLTTQQLQALYPWLIVLGGIALATMAGVIRSLGQKWPAFVFALLTCAAGIASSVSRMAVGPVELFGGMMVSDGFAQFFNVLFLFSAAVTAVVSLKYLDREDMQHPEYYLLIMLSTLGMMLMGSSINLMMIFIALELMSLSVYVLVGFRRADRRSNEAAMKYFILGSAASAVMLYGAALLYGATGTLNIREIAQVAKANPGLMTSMFGLGAWLVFTGFLFKVAAVPFHMWMPDVYEGAPAPITGFMTTGIKAASFAAFVRVFHSLGYGATLSEAIQTHLHHILWVCAVLTMVLGNVIALTQTNLKRMLAYSSIAHTGYLIVGLLAAPKSELGYAPVVVYLVSYTAMNLGAFLILTMMAKKNDLGLNLQDLSGLARSQPWLAFALAVFLFSLAGIPPMAGFIAKYLLFYGAVQAGEISITVIAVLCSAVSVYYYLRVLVYMYMRDPVGTVERVSHSKWAMAACALLVAITLQVGILPASLLEVAKAVVRSI